MRNRKLFITALISALLALVLVAGWYILYTHYLDLRESFDQLQRDLITGIDARDADLERVRINQRILYQNLNQNRKALKLPEVPEIFSEPDLNAVDLSESASGTAEYSGDLFFRGIDYFSGFYSGRETEYRLSEVLDTELFRNWLDSSGLSMQRKSHAEYRLVSGADFSPVFLIEIYNTEDLKQIKTKTLLGSEKLISLEGSPETVAGELSGYAADEIEELKKTDKIFLKQVEICEKIISRELQKTVPETDELEAEIPSSIQPYTDYVCSLKYIDPEEQTENTLFYMGVEFPSGLFFIGSEKFPVPEEFSYALSERIRGIDTRTAAEKKVDELTELIRGLSADTSFQAFLNERGLKMASQSRENGDYLYFDLFDREGRRYGAFAVLKKVGKIYLTDSEDVVITSLMTVGTSPALKINNPPGFFTEREDKEDEGKEIDLPKASMFSQAGRSTGATLLLCGTHEKNADTIIIAHMGADNQVRLLSVPRDIYYKYRKLNTHYRRYGMERLVDIVQDITGLQFDGYISVDMYAFIDIIDVLQGIDITLEAPLRDPTYKVREDGVWTTLYYPPGRHHLTGIEALRVVRSRHTSDDFDRAYRQQLVIQALWERLNQLDAGELKEVYNIFSVLHRYVSTDMNVYDLAQYFLQYRHAEIMPKKSISTDNILYTTYSNFYLSGLTEDDVEEDFDKGAWILLPKDDDWDLIHRFIYQELYN